MISTNIQDDTKLVDCIFEADNSILFQQNNPEDWEDFDWYPLFDFRLKKDSPAKDVADVEIATQIPYDLNGFHRLTDDFPDLGAYEYYDED